MSDQAKTTYDVFLSHNSADKPEVELIGSRLREAGLNPFLDKWHLVPGNPWQKELDEALKQSACTAIFFGQSGSGPWHNEEMQIALNHAVRTRNDYRAIPVLLPGADPQQVNGFLELRTWVDFRTGLDDQVAFDRLVAAVQGVAPDSAEGLLELPDDTRPYQGIECFDRDQAEFFFGRDEEIRRLIERMEQDHFVAVVGASGSGKSSLARAGFFTDAAKQAKPGIDQWRRIVLKPKSNPLLELATQLVAHLPLAERSKLIDSFQDKFRESAEGLNTALATLFPNSDKPVLLLIDQFEELFTQRPPLEVDQTEWLQRTGCFAANLLTTVNHRHDGLRIVVTLRADFVDRFVGGEFPDFRTLLERRQFWLGAMGEDDLREVVVRPATQCGAFFEKGLVERILKGTRNEASALPLLEEALTSLWDHRRGPWLTHEAYDQIGGVGGALAKKADQVFDSLTKAEQAIARRMFLTLIQLGEGARDTRRRVSVDSLETTTVDSSAFQTVLRKFSDQGARLIRFSANEETGQNDASSTERTAEVTHEALIDHWTQLSGWLEESRDDLRLERRLEEAAKRWQEEHDKDNGQPDGLLWRPPDLDLARDYMQRIEGNLPAELLDFYQRSDHAEKERIAREEERRERERAQERKLAEEQKKRAKEQKLAATRFKRIAFIAGVIAAIAVGVGIYALVKRYEAEVAKQDALEEKGIADDAKKKAEEKTKEVLIAKMETNRKLGEANELLAQIAIGVEHNPIKATHFLYLASADFRDADDWREPRMHLLGLERSHCGLEKTFPHGGIVYGAKLFSKDARLLTHGSDGSARIWDVEQGKEIQQFKHEGEQAYVYGAELFSDNTQLLTWSFDGTVRIWDIEHKKEIQRFQHGADAKGAKIFLENTRLLTWGSNGKARIWDVEHGKEIQRFEHEGIGVFGDSFSILGTALFSRDTRLLTWGSDGTARIWDVEQGQKIQEFLHGGVLDPILDAELFADDTRLLTWGTDGTARIWDVEYGTEIQRFEHERSEGEIGALGGSFSILGAELFSGDTRLLTWSEDGTTRIWDLEQEKELKQFKHGGLNSERKPIRVLGATLFADHTRLLTWGSDRTARIWDVGQKKELKQFKHKGTDSDGNPFELFGAKLFANHKQLLTWSEDATARIWDVEHEKEIQQFKHEGRITGAELFSGDTRLLTWSADATTRIWDVEQGKEIQQFRREGRITDAKLFSGNRRLLTWSENGTTSIWDVEQEKELKQFKHEGTDSDGNPLELFGAKLFSDHKRLLTWSEDATARIWDVEHEKEIQQFKHKGRITGAELFSGDTRLLTWSEDATARIWDVERRKEIQQFDHEGRITGARLFSRDTRLLTWSRDATARIWDVEQGKEIQQFNHDRAVNGVKMFSAETRLLTWSTDATARIWDIEHEKEIKQFKHDETFLLDQAVNYAELFSGNTRLLTLRSDKTAFIWDVEKRKEIQRFKHEGDFAFVFGAMLFSQNTRLLTWSSKTARIWDVEQGKEIQQFNHDSDVNGAKMFSAETRLLTWSSKTAHIWDVEQGEEIQQFKHNSKVNGAKMFSANTHLLTWGDDGTARIWDVDTSVSVERRLREWEIRSATKIDEMTGEFRVLKYDEWESLRRKLMDTYGGFSDRN